MPIKDKINVLKAIKKDCRENSLSYKKRYKKLKKIDDAIDLINSILNASSIALIMSIPAIPPLFIGSGVCSSIQFIISRSQDKMNLKQKYNRHLTSSNQYENLMREIITVLNKNHLTNEQYEAYIEEVHDKLSLISDTALL